MSVVKAGPLIERRYRQVFGAAVRPAFATYVCHRASSATLGYRRAGNDQLGLEAYLDAPIEVLATRAFNRPVKREAIVEIGNFAADNAFAMIDLWGAAANDLGSSSEVVVATLTAKLRQTFARLGVPIVELSDADPAKIGAGGEWGQYYQHEPKVCAGLIAEGQQALSAFHARRKTRTGA